jgi:hypothetical protein
MINGIVQWDPSITDHTFPSSCYLTSKPSFMGSTQWPVFGPDVAGQYILPAQQRYESGENISEVKKITAHAPSFCGRFRSPDCIYNIKGQKIGTAINPLSSNVNSRIQTSSGRYFTFTEQGIVNGFNVTK